jgi:hypothetical protein
MEARLRQAELAQASSRAEEERKRRRLTVELDLHNWLEPHLLLREAEALLRETDKPGPAGRSEKE